MATLLLREVRKFTVDLPAEEAWRHLAQVERWPSWATHIRRVEVRPPGELGPTSTGYFQLTNGARPVFAVTEYNSFRNWKWVGNFLWMTVHYDHLFEELDLARTKVTFVIEAQGFGVSVIGRLFAKVYGRTLDRVIPALVREMNASRV